MPMLYKHKDFITKLSLLKKQKKHLATFIKNSNKNEIKSLGELAYNILNGGVRCNTYTKNKLKSCKASLRILANKKKGLNLKKKHLMKGKGLLLGSLIPLALSVISKIFKTLKKK